MILVLVYCQSWAEPLAWAIGVPASLFGAGYFFKNL